MLGMVEEAILKRWSTRRWPDQTWSLIWSMMASTIAISGTNASSLFKWRSSIRRQNWLPIYEMSGTFGNFHPIEMNSQNPLGVNVACWNRDLEMISAVKLSASLCGSSLSIVITMIVFIFTCTSLKQLTPHGEIVFLFFKTKNTHLKKTCVMNFWENKPINQNGLKYSLIQQDNEMDCESAVQLFARVVLNSNMELPNDSTWRHITHGAAIHSFFVEIRWKWPRKHSFCRLRHR